MILVVLSKFPNENSVSFVVFHYIGPKNALKALLVKIVCKTLFSQEIRDLYGKTMF